MKNSLISHFLTISAKRLSSVEVLPEASNQHEFNGVTGFKKIFGTTKRHFYGTFILLDDDDEKIITSSSKLTWYDARENHPTRTEHRLYYKSNNVILNASPNDLLVLGLTSAKELTIIIAPEGSTMERQLLWLFNFVDLTSKFQTRQVIPEDQNLDYTAKIILDVLGIDAFDETPGYLDEMLDKFNKKFPSTKEFSAFARSKVDNAEPLTNPDSTLTQWLEMEESLFRTLEHHFVTHKLNVGFADVEDFIKYSLSVQNRRKSRAGHSFEHHLAAIFDASNVCYSRGSKTERNNKPDFLFPSIGAYNNESFPADALVMLGVKTTAKDRWRQILTEADRINTKHLITLEPAISENQTNEMTEQNIQLVIPTPIQKSYSLDQLKNIISLNEFINLATFKN